MYSSKTKKDFANAAQFYVLTQLSSAKAAQLC